MLRYLLFVLALSACGDAPSSPDDGAQADANDGAADSAAPDAVPSDPCGGVVVACPSPPALTEGAGLVAIDRCAFPLDDRDEWSTRGAVITALDAELDAVGIADVLGDLNRTGSRITAGAVPGDPPGVQQAFAWQSGDMSVAYWIPQGITGSGDGIAGTGRVGDRNVVLVSWYYSPANDPGSTAQKGVRIAIVDVTNPDDIRYRFALLAEPRTIDGRADYVSVPIHAGGIAWVGDYLYVVDTGTGFRVFDLTRILRVSAAEDLMGYSAGTYYAHGYAYVIPQIGTLADDTACNARFSFVSLDRTTTPPSLLSGEYDAASIAGRLYRWPLAADGRPQLVEGARLVPDGAWYMGHSHVQGALSLDEVFWLSSSKPSDAAGELYRARIAASSATLGWIDTPEDLFYDPPTDRVWSLSEGTNARYVIAVDRASID